MSSRKGGYKGHGSNNQRSVRSSDVEDPEFRRNNKFYKVLTKEDRNKKTHELAYDMVAEGSTDAEVLNKIVIDCLDPNAECNFDINRWRTGPPPTFNPI